LVGSGEVHSTADKELIGFQDVKQLSIEEYILVGSESE
jgi:hypothetical protein